jgi:hypothetical protein
MTFNAKQFLRELCETGLDEANLAGDVKIFSSTHGNGPGKAFGSLNDLQKNNLQAAKDNLEKSQHHDGMAQQHSELATTAKGQGDKTLSSLHADAASSHSDLAQQHSDLAAQHMKKAKSGAAQNLGEGFGLRTMDPNVLYKPFQPQDKVSYDVPRQKHGQSATVEDLQRISNEVFARNQCAVTLVRVLETNGFVVSVLLPPGNYGGTATPSVPALEAELIKAVREEIPYAVVDLLDQGAVVGSSPGQYRSRAYFRFRLRDLHRGDLGGP